MVSRSRPRTPEPLYRVSLGSPGDLAAAIPQLIGFHPRESVVLIALGGASGKRVGLTVRGDIPPPQCAGTIADMVVSSIRRNEPAGVVVAMVSEAPDDPVAGLPHRTLLREITLALAAVPLPVRLALLVRGGRWWDYDEPGDTGTPLPGGVSALEAASIATGQVVAGSREELVERIAPPGGRARGDMAAVAKRVDLEQSDRVAALGLDAVGEETWTAIIDGLTRCRDRAPLTDPALARITWGLRDVLVRDRALQLALDDDPAVESLWTACTRRAPRSWVPAPATLLAVCAWLRGDGAMAAVALDRALKVDPGYRFARLLSEGLGACVPPAELRALIVSSTDDPVPGR
jgi:hypothetical protein